MRLNACLGTAIAATVILAGLALGPSPARAEEEEALNPQADVVQLALLPPPPRMIGLASWYGGRHNGRKTASGEVFSIKALTAAHRSLPLGTVLKVVNQQNGRSVVVRITDRGPFSGERILDLSEAAARKLDMLAAGVAPVRLELVAAR